MKKVVTFSLISFGLMGLLKVFSVIPFVRFSDDDFGYLVVKLNKFWQLQLNTYLGWTGRFTSTFIQSLFGNITGLEGKPIVYSLIALAILFVALAIFYSRFLNQKLARLSVILLSCVSLVTLYLITPNKAESWYWMTGSVNYLWPIIFLLLGISNAFVKKAKNIDYILSFIFIFLSCAGNEAFGFLTLTILVGVLIFTVLVRHQNKLLLTMTIAAAISYALVYFAPGNAVRASGGGSNPMSWFGSFAYAVETGPGYLYSLVTKNLFLLLPLMVVFSFYFSEIRPKTENKIDLENILIKLFVIFSSVILVGSLYMFPAFRILGRVPPDRSDITLSFVILAATVTSSYYLSFLFLSKNIVNSSVLKIVIFFSAFLIFVSAFQMMSTFASDIYIAKNYSDVYDKMVIQFKNASVQGYKKNLVVEKLPDSGLIAPLRLQYDWIREDVADYYKISGIIYNQND